jgi:hypothetical protein
MRLRPPPNHFEKTDIYPILYERSPEQPPLWILESAEPLDQENRKTFTSGHHIAEKLGRLSSKLYVPSEPELLV